MRKPGISGLAVSVFALIALSGCAGFAVPRDRVQSSRPAASSPLIPFRLLTAHGSGEGGDAAGRTAWPVGGLPRCASESGAPSTSRGVLVAPAFLGWTR